MANLEGQKQYSRIDYDDPELLVFFEAAKKYLKGAGVLPEKSSESGEQTTENLYDICIYMLADHWYNMRGVMSEGKYTKELPFSVTAIILQLREGGNKNELGEL